MKNFFEIFNFKIDFEIDKEELEKKYLNLQKHFHPDISNSNDIEQSLIINEAYKTLKDDFNRACYLLTLKSIDINEDKNFIQVDKSTLQEILLLQEEISVVKSKIRIKKITLTIQQQIDDLLLNFVSAFKNNRINESTQILIKVKYLKKSLIDLKLKNKLFVK